MKIIIIATLGLALGFLWGRNVGYQNGLYANHDLYQGVVKQNFDNFDKLRACEEAHRKDRILLDGLCSMTKECSPVVDK